MTKTAIKSFAERVVVYFRKKGVSEAVIENVMAAHADDIQRAYELLQYALKAKDWSPLAGLGEDMDFCG